MFVLSAEKAVVNVGKNRVLVCRTDVMNDSFFVSTVIAGMILFKSSHTDSAYD